MGDEDYVQTKRTNRIYFSKEFPAGTPEGRRPARYVSRVFEARDRTHFADINGEVVLRVTPSGREQIKALFLVDDREVKHLVLQRFSVDTEKPRQQAYFSLRDDEIHKLLDLALLVRTAQFEKEDKVRLEEGDLAQFSLSRDAARVLLKSNTKLLAEIIERDVTERDVVAVAYRREQLKRFRALLENDEFFTAEKLRLGCRGDEALWQRFFEANPWIFGYSLFYVFASGFDERKLEQTVSGAHVGAAGKRVDALLRTRGIVSSLCFVEIKTHRTPLLDDKSYRPEVWAPSHDVTQAVAQLQKTVESAERAIGRRLDIRDGDGNATGESAFLVRPRSVLVVGNLGQFSRPAGVNEPRYTSFELFRRQLVAPELVTFDELYERARFIVDSSERPPSWRS